MASEVKEHPETASRHAQLGIAYADLGRKEDALREGRCALELLPESKDAYYGLDITNIFNLICARLGDGDLAHSVDRATAQDAARRGCYRISGLS